MKITVASVVVAFLVVMSLAPSAMAGSTGTISAKGSVLEADVFSVDSSGIHREILVQAGTIASHSPGGPPANSPFVFVVYVVVDTTTNTLLDEGSGYIDGTFTVAKDLSSGSVSASGTVSSAIDGSPHTVTVDLSLTASGPQIEEDAIIHAFEVGTIKLVEKVKETLQGATATGDASIDDVDLGSFSSNFAELAFAKQSLLTVSSP